MNTDASSDDPFVCTPDQPGFEALAHSNGFRFWWASKLAEVLGYESLHSFRKAVQRAMVVLTTLNIPIFENIVPTQREIDGKTEEDFKLSRFACYLAAMNGDVKKPRVAQAQQYFIQWGEACRLFLEESDSIERVQIRGEISEHERTLAGTANAAGVERDRWGLFQNAGYRGLYNMDLYKLRQHKGIPSNRSPLDFMGKTELAANLFRVTQTEEKIRAEMIRGQTALENAAYVVGRKVRKTMEEISGKRPEDLPAAPDIRTVQKKLKTSHREIRKIDGGKKSG